MRAFGLVVAVVAAVAVFVVGGRDGGQSWQIPGLVLIGVLVLILWAATSGRGRIRPVEARDLHQAPQVQPNPHHMADPNLAEMHRTADAIPVDGVGHIVVPASSFPDAGHGHGPVISVSGDSPPPMRTVLQPPPPQQPQSPPPYHPPSQVPAPPAVDGAVVDGTGPGSGG